MNNTTETSLPQFSSIVFDNVEQSFDRLIVNNREKINQLLSSTEKFTWETLIESYEDINNQLTQKWSLISHLKNVADSEVLRKIYHNCLPKITDYFTELSHHEGLFHAVQSIADGAEYQKLNKVQKKVIDNEIRDFTLAGVNLPLEKKQSLAELMKTLSQLQNQFEENLLDATRGWHKQVTDENELSGIPEHAKVLAKETAERLSLEGWVFTLQLPDYLAVLAHADARSLREEMYTAYSTRASDQGPNAGCWDNSKIMEQILRSRLKIARLLGFSNYAEYSLATKMVKSPKEVLAFLNKLAEAILPKARKEFELLCEFSKKELTIEKLEPWDLPYAAEKLREQQYAISQEELRLYFPEPRVISGLFEVVNKLFNITVKPVNQADVWHPDVHCYGVYNNQNQLISYFYFDLYSREDKRKGAWMDDYRARCRLMSGKLQLPIAFVVCNFNAPIGNHPALFTHEDVITLFHEFGHTLQHMLTKIDYAAVSGIHGIPWDAVEIASQFFENWAWQKEPLSMISSHYQTGESLPDDLFERLNRAKNFHAAMQSMRQLEFALFDMRLHIEFDPEQENQIQHILDEVRSVTNVICPPSFNRFQHSFSHIFAGGYAAGYYSYKWAEVMAADAFSVFEEKGVFDSNSAKRFQTYILEPGGSEDPMDLFKAFRGREPKIEALLRQKGIL